MVERRGRWAAAVVGIAMFGTLGVAAAAEGVCAQEGPDLDVARVSVWACVAESGTNHSYPVQTDASAWAGDDETASVEAHQVHAEVGSRDWQGPTAGSRSTSAEVGVRSVGVWLPGTGTWVGSSWPGVYGGQWEGHYSNGSHRWTGVGGRIGVRAADVGVHVEMDVGQREVNGQCSHTVSYYDEIGEDYEEVSVDDCPVRAPDLPGFPSP